MDNVYLIFNKGYAFTQYSHPGPTISSQTVDADITNTAYDSGFKPLKFSNEIPHRGLAVAVSFPTNPTSTGATGTASLQITVLYSDDGTNPVSGLSVKPQPIVFTFASSTAPGQKQYFFRLPRTKHKWMKVQIATTLTTITGADYGPVNIALVNLPDTEASNMIDIG